MSKTYNERPSFRFQSVKPENLNDNLTGILSEVNGNLNANNMPVASITFDNFADSESTETATATNSVLDYEGATQGYHRIKRWNVAEGGLDVWEPIETIDLEVDNWSTGWNRLTDYGTMDTTYLQFNAQEGMINGFAIIDFQHGVNRIVYTTDQGTFRVFFGYDWWTEWGLFVNDVLIAQTGKIYPRRITCTIPFSVPCGSQLLKLDLRWRSTTSEAVGTTFVPDPTTALDIYGAEIICRNTKR